MCVICKNVPVISPGRFCIKCYSSGVYLHARGAGGGLANHTELFSYFDESGNGFVQVGLLVGGAQLHAETGLALRHNRVVEARDEDAFLGHGGGALWVGLMSKPAAIILSRK